MELTAEDIGYPARLHDLRPAPDPIWVDGDPAALSGPAVAIVGTRRMSGYGERVARELAIACAGAGVVVVSGFAQGIDTCAHRGAVDGGGRTIAVLGESIPAFRKWTRDRRRALIPRVRATGLLLSQYATPFGAKPWMYVRRNPTIAALADAVVIVEAPLGSGALITARAARRIGRALYAVPGPLGAATSVGTNTLIATGLARAVTAPGDILDAVGARLASAPSRHLDPLLAELRDGALGLDELSARLRLPPAALSSRVAALVVRGVVRTLPDGRIALRL